MRNPGARITLDVAPSEMALSYNEHAEGSSSEPSVLVPLINQVKCLINVINSDHNTDDFV